MKRSGWQWKAGWRWVVVVGVVVILALLGELSLAELAGQPALGVRAEHHGSELVVSWVQPIGPAWDGGIRPGLVVVAVDGSPVTPYLNPDAVGEAQMITVRDANGSLNTASIVGARQAAEQRKLGFLGIAVESVVVGGLVFVLAADLLAASVMFTLFAVGAAALLAGIAGPFGVAWVLAIEAAAIQLFGMMVLLFFLVFPINRLGASWGRWLGGAGVGISVVSVGLAVWPLLVDSSPSIVGEYLRYLIEGILAGDIIAGVGLAVIALVDRSDQQIQVRRSLGLVVLGMAAGLVPFCMLSLIPNLLGRGYLVSPDISILSVSILVASLGAAILSQQMLGVRPRVERGLIALTVWLTLLGVFSVGVDLLRGGILDSMVFKVAIVAAAFYPLQKLLRESIEHWLLRDVYDYPQTLHQLSDEIAVLSGVESIAQHVLARLGKTLDLSWVALALREEDAGPLLYRWGDWPTEVDSCAPGSSVTEGRPGLRAVDWALGAREMALMAEGTSIGTLVVGPKHRGIDLTPEDETLISTLAPLIGTALRNALLVRALERQVEVLRERESELGALSARLLHVQEEERKELAFELHDDPLQRAILLARNLGNVPPDEQTANWRQSVEEIIGSLRATCADLHPPVLDDLGLVPGLERLVNSVRARSDLDVQLTAYGYDAWSFGRLDPGLEVALYRVVQEALHNCVKHAEASQVKVLLWRDDGLVKVKVKDNGRGFRPDGEGDGAVTRLGILGMRERLRPWDGVLTIQSEADGGTTVTAEVMVGGC